MDSQECHRTNSSDGRYAIAADAEAHATVDEPLIDAHAAAHPACVITTNDAALTADDGNAAPAANDATSAVNDGTAEHDAALTIDDGLTEHDAVTHATTANDAASAVDDGTAAHAATVDAVPQLTAAVLPAVITCF